MNLSEIIEQVRMDVINHVIEDLDRDTIDWDELTPPCERCLKRTQQEIKAEFIVTCYNNCCRNWPSWLFCSKCSSLQNWHCKHCLSPNSYLVVGTL